MAFVWCKQELPYESRAPEYLNKDCVFLGSERQSDLRCKVNSDAREKNNPPKQAEPTEINSNVRTFLLSLLKELLSKFDVVKLS